LVSFFKISSFLFRILRNSIDEICILLGHGLFFSFPRLKITFMERRCWVRVSIQLIGNQIYLVSIEFTHFKEKKKHGPTIVFGIFVDDILLVYIPPPLLLLLFGCCWSPECVCVCVTLWVFFFPLWVVLIQACRNIPFILGFCRKFIFLLPGFSIAPCS
jgi:hypothetical protein